MKDQIEKLANEMDESAENINAHDFVITHRALAILSAQTIGDEATLKLLTALQKERGLPGLTGVCGREPKGGNILHRLNITEDWGDWKMPNIEPSYGAQTKK